MKYLVTGGLGFIGSHIVDRLLKDGHEVIVVDNKETNNLDQHKDNKKLTIKPMSILDNDIERIFADKDIDAVFHLAAIPNVQFSIKNPIETNEANITGILTMLNLCKEFGVKRFVFSSSSSIYGDQDKLPIVETMTPNPMSPYALQKLVGEMYCSLFNKLFELETISLRYFNVYGPRQDPEGDYAALIPKFIKLLKEDKQPTIYGDGEQSRDFCFVTDVVEANLKAATTKNKEVFGQACNIGGGNNFTVNKVTEMLIKLNGKDIEPTHLPPVIESRATLADVSKAKKLLNWEPKMKFEDGLKETFEFFSS